MITIGVTTYNRKQILVRMAKSLYDSDLCVPYNIRIYDDASTDFGVNFLRELFPDAAEIFVQPKNIGSDANIRYMYEDFLKSGDKYFFNADSDLIFRKDWLSVLINLISKTDGVLSAFNSLSHGTFSSTFIDDYKVEEKNDLGSAGTLFTREAVDFLVNGLKKESFSSFDWKWSFLFRNKGIKLYSVTDSLCQHIGIEGYNSAGGRFDYGNNFFIDSVQNGQFINDTLHDLSLMKSAGQSRKTYCLFPFEKIPFNSKILIYGAGKFGSDLYSQAKMTGVYDIVAVADKSFSDNEFFISPDKICNMKFDYVLIAVNNPIVVNEIYQKLKKMGVESKKIVMGCCDRTIRLHDKLCE